MLVAFTDNNQTKPIGGNMKLKPFLLYVSSVLLFASYACNSGGGSSGSAETSSTGSGVDSSLAKPVFTPVGGTYLKGELLQVAAPTGGTKVNITTDDSNPTAFHYNFSAVSQDLSVDTVGTLTVKAVTWDTARNVISDTETQTYDLIANPDSTGNTVPILQTNYYYDPSISATASGGNYFTFTSKPGWNYVFDACDMGNASRNITLDTYSDSTYTSVTTPAGSKFELAPGTLNDGSQIVINSASAQGYYIKVKEKNGNAVDDYRFVAYVPDYLNFAHTIVPKKDTALDGTSQGFTSTFAKKCERHFYKFTAKANESYIIYTDAKTADIDTMLVVYKSGLTGIKNTDDDGYGASSAKCAHCSKAATIKETVDTEYYFMVKAKGTASTGAYGVYIYQP
jgi:hypothetical protein